MSALINLLGCLVGAVCVLGCSGSGPVGESGQPPTKSQEKTMTKQESALVTRGTLEGKMFWPEVFTNPDFEYPGEGREKGGRTFLCALADGLVGWGNCDAGDTPPKNFGHGMTKIASIAGSALPEKLMEIAKSLEK